MMIATAMQNYKPPEQRGWFGKREPTWEEQILEGELYAGKPDIYGADQTSGKEALGNLDENVKQFGKEVGKDLAVQAATRGILRGVG